MKENKGSHLVLKKLKRNLNIYFFYLDIKNVYNNKRYNDTSFYRKYYKKTHGENPNLTTPSTFSEKLVWSLLNHRNELYIKCADKFEVREFVKERIGDKYLINCLNIYSTIQEVDFNTLPNQFVLKATHASGWNLIVSDKNNFDRKKAFRTINYWLNHNYYAWNREWPYKFMKQRVICEEFIGTQDGTPPLDYKFFCFNGEPKLIQLDIGRSRNHQRNIYDINWNHIKGVEIAHEQDYSKSYNKPDNLEEMITVAKKLSKGFEHVRIDLYNVDGKIYFGEMTFFHGAGVFEYFRPKEFHLKVGGWFKLPVKNI